MNQDNFITQIRLEYQYLTKAEKKVADYILENAQEVLFMSITDLAAACKVGETTVFRFCKSMKLQGYQEFRIQLSLSMQNEEEKSEQETLNGKYWNGRFFFDDGSKIIKFKYECIDGNECTA